MSHSERMFFYAGREIGFRDLYLHRARIERNPKLVRLAREANWEYLRYVKAART